MAQEEKQLLIKDLCARLPHGVVAYASEINKNGIITDVNIPYNMVNLTIDNADGKYEPVPLFDIKLYLRPMSSMTEEEKDEYFSFFTKEEVEYNQGCKFFYRYIIDSRHPKLIDALYDWLNAHHFDYRGLIEKGLALEAPEDMYKI